MSDRVNPNQAEERPRQEANEGQTARQVASCDETEEAGQPLASLLKTSRCGGQGGRHLNDCSAQKG